MLCHSFISTMCRDELAFYWSSWVFYCVFLTLFYRNFLSFIFLPVLIVYVWRIYVLLLISWMTARFRPYFKALFVRSCPVHGLQLFTPMTVSTIILHVCYSKRPLLADCIQAIPVCQSCRHLSFSLHVICHSQPQCREWRDHCKHVTHTTSENVTLAKFWILDVNLFYRIVGLSYRQPIVK